MRKIFFIIISTLLALSFSFTSNAYFSYKKEDILGKKNTNAVFYLENQEILFHTNIHNIERQQINILKLSLKNKYTKYDKEVIVLSKIVYREARGMETTKEKAAVVWCILNRVDSNDPLYSNDIIEVATQRSQFAWIPDTPIDEELVNLVLDVLYRWNLEKYTLKNEGRVLPKDYLFFAAHSDKKNYFRKNYESRVYWDWSLPDPYND